MYLLKLHYEIHLPNRLRLNPWPGSWAPDLGYSSVVLGLEIRKDTLPLWDNQRQFNPPLYDSDPKRAEFT